MGAGTKCCCSLFQTLFFPSKCKKKKLWSGYARLAIVCDVHLIINFIFSVCVCVGVCVCVHACVYHYV